MRQKILRVQRAGCSHAGRSVVITSFQPRADTTAMDASQFFNALLAYADKHWVGATLVATVLLAGALVVLNGMSGWFDRRHPLNDDQRTKLALGAPYFCLHSFSWQYVEGVRPLARIWFRFQLARIWGIRNPSDAREVLNELASSTHAASIPGTETASPEGAAWDAVRLVFIARLCAALRYITMDALWGYAEAAATLARNSGCRDWRHWGQAFLQGRAVWAGQHDGGYALVVERLHADGNSPWRTIDFNRAIGRPREAREV